MLYRPTVHPDGEVTVETLNIASALVFQSTFIKMHKWLTLEQYEEWCELRSAVAKANQQSGINTDF